MMFEKFGELKSVEEINKTAEGLKNEGDLESLLIFAKENGIDKEDAEDYMDGCFEELVNLTTASAGRLKAMKKADIDNEKDAIKKMAKRVILQAMEPMIKDQELAAGILRQGNSLEKIFKEMENGARKHKTGSMGVSCGTDQQLENIIKACITGSDVAAEIEKLYEG